jgi:hypothetical protein
MTQKDYILIAEVIKNSDLGFNRYHLAHEFAVMLKSQAKYNLKGNRLWKEDVFMEACGVNEELDVPEFLRRQS